MTRWTALYRNDEFNLNLQICNIWANNYGLNHPNSAQEVVLFKLTHSDCKSRPM